MKKAASASLQIVCATTRSVPKTGLSPPVINAQGEVASRYRTQLRNKGGARSNQQCRSRRSDIREQRACTISASRNTLRQRITPDKSYKELDGMHCILSL